jgi:hypothetical protein
VEQEISWVRKIAAPQESTYEDNVEYLFEVSMRQNEESRARAVKIITARDCTP